MSILQNDILRAARGLAGWSVSELAERSGVSASTINGFESNDPSRKGSGLSQRTAKKIIEAFESAGVEITSDGVRKKQDYFKIYRGSEGFKDFMDHVYHTAKTLSGEFCIYNARPTNWIKWLGVEWNKMHSDRMAALENKPTFRITSQHGDTNLIGNRHAEYRWIPDDLWHDQSIYVYGDFIAFMIFKEDAVTIKVFKDHDVYEHILSVFNHIWETASIIPEGIAHKPVD